MPDLSSASSNWRDRLIPIAAAPASDPIRLGLRAELREVIPRTAARWNGPTSRAVTAASLEAPSLPAHVRLAIRPVLRGPRGWLTTGVGWNTIAHQRHRLGLGEAEQRWFAQFTALYRATIPAETGQDPQWYTLDGFDNPLLWPLLTQAVALNIPLVGSRTVPEIRLAGAGTVSLDLSETEEGVLLRSRVEIDGEEVLSELTRALGTHGVYALSTETPRTLTLAPLSTPLPAEYADLLGASPVRVPTAERREFERDFLPALAQRVSLRSSDQSIAVPEPVPVTLILHVQHEPRHTVSLHWEWSELPPGGAPLRVADALPEGILPEGWAIDPAPGGLPSARKLRDFDAAEFATDLLPALAALPGVRVEQHGVSPEYRRLRGTPQISVRAEPGTRTDWFDLGVTVTVDGVQIPFEPLFRALARNARRLKLVDGTYFSLKHPAFAPLAELIHAGSDAAEWITSPSIGPHQATLWNDLTEHADHVESDPAWQRLVSALTAEAPSESAEPEGLAATLRPYQRAGLGWLKFGYEHGLGGILADDMGLGKTLQCLALIRHARTQKPTDGPFVVVAPTSVVANWAAEAARFTPGLVVRTVRGTRASGEPGIAELADGADILITSYTLLRLDHEEYARPASPWAGLILDEAQAVKNASAQTHVRAREFPARWKLALTGTPLENSLSDLHALFAVVSPGLLPPAARFTLEYVRPVESEPAGISRGVGAGRGPADRAAHRLAVLARLRERIRPFVLRRTKEEVAPELPDRQEQVIEVDLAPAHRDLYDVYLQRERQKVLDLLEDLDRQRFIVFRSLTLLRMLALDPALIDAEEHADIPASKIDLLIAHLLEARAEGHRALVFSQYPSFLRRIGDRLAEVGLAWELLDGSTTHRQEVIDRFQNGDAPVFLLSLRAGGVGLNLTAADYVFLLDPWWNPAAENQAIDRAHRIGQTRHVFVYRLIARDTIEEKVLALQRKKSALFDAMFTGSDAVGAGLTAEDIRGLLS
ncbi:DEAD/DEAH box helicase [Mycetocola tolaasinivorans]|uniref:DEAD/DEAH box helicase n=1 Tax=Mycetocola tolaasinivorans TaxID=76635 RepID=A0A3L7AAD6_9MICO|nr:DEAD/DEAH box helicase [Mycetocola tolaasinivorans]RLP76788.1 DEAD/DEAH box helicase [Mycetocola tolaasinivorans]